MDDLEKSAQYFDRPCMLSNNIILLVFHKWIIYVLESVYR